MTLSIPVHMIQGLSRLGEDDVFVITGGGSGIGRALALALDRLGHAVTIVGRREACLAAVAAESARIQVCCADVTTSSGREKIVHQLRTVPTIQACVHNAGVIEPIVAMRELTESAWRSVMATNVEAPLWLTQALYPQLLGGRVLHVGSGAAYFPVHGWAAYCVSKAALSMLTRCWQLENPDLHVASVMPGIIDTDMQRVIRQATHMDKAKHAYFLELKATHRLLDVEEVAQFLVYLLLDVSTAMFSAKEWDIYTDSSHEFPDA